jgi:hypothetical protein
MIQRSSKDFEPKLRRNERFLFETDEKVLNLYSEIIVEASINFLNIGQDKNSTFQSSLNSQKFDFVLNMIRIQ